ncbi:MAG: RNA 3'-terminal phosphate cyclase [Methanomassiliicoccales archaeon]|nr:RNA 3'-terminal phosphate cyclase [Methanomassiliicoccales archaeon]
MIEIDGSEGEGGGQLLRCAVAMSALTGKEVRVFNIRAGRPKPGLASQHLAAVNGVASLCNARTSGAVAGSTDLSFFPGPLSGGERKLDVGTAGSISLVLQACILPAIRSDEMTTLEVSGGTNVRWSPPIDYYSNLLLPMLRRMGVEVRMQVESRGFYPESGGKVTVEIEPSADISPLDLSERGPLKGLRGVCFSQNLPEHICRRMSHSVKKAFLNEGGVSTRNDVSRGRSTGAGICLFAEYDRTILGADALGERGVPAEKVGENAIEALRKEMYGTGTLDVHSADQLVPYTALANGRSVFRVREVTKHLRTQMWLIGKFLDSTFHVESLAGGYEVAVAP